MFKCLVLFLCFVSLFSCVPFVFSAPVIFLVIWFYPRNVNSDLTFVLVLGDVGHSPRTFNQVASLIGIGKRVVLFGFSGSALPEISKSFLETGKLRIVALREFQFYFVPFRLARYILKTIVQSVSISFSLFFTCAQNSEYPRNILVQNPPSIPSLAVSYIFAQITDSKFIIDWHNYGYSIMELQKANFILVKIAKIYEKLLSRLSDGNFTVTSAMKKDIEKWGSQNVHVLYDKPHPRFSKLAPAEKLEFLNRIEKEIPILEKVKNGIPLLVSSTSWTEDEDFSILLNALSICNESKNEMVVAITGKGPQKAFYLEEIKNRNFEFISIVTPWLEVSDYPKLLGISNLGVCLHSSSSGLDLPMKVVDMFGAGLPVLALNFPALPELVKDGKNGRMFNNSDELANLILTTLADQNKIDQFSNFIQENRESWDDHWSQTAKHIFL